MIKTQITYEDFDKVDIRVVLLSKMKKLYLLPDLEEFLLFSESLKTMYVRSPAMRTKAVAIWEFVLKFKKSFSVI